MPFTVEMIAVLRTFIELDMPFPQRGRYDRVDRLEANMDRADLAVTEKYRQIMEAYQIGFIEESRQYQAQISQ